VLPCGACSLTPGELQDREEVALTLKKSYKQVKLSRNVKQIQTEVDKLFSTFDVGNKG